MKEKTTEMMTENYCDDCEDVLHAVFDTKDFYDFKVGRIRCKCGCVVKPCNECLDENGQHYNCAKCPWEHAKIVDAMTDEEHIKWTKDNEPKLFARMLKGDCGEYEQELAKKLVDETDDDDFTPVEEAINNVLNLIEETVEQIRVLHKVEKKLDSTELIAILAKLDYEFEDIVDDGIIFKDMSFKPNRFEAEKLFKFKNWDEVRKYVKYLEENGFI